MRLWHLLPILLPAGWVVGTFLDLWPDPQRELLANPLMALVGLALGLVLAIAIDLAFKRVRVERLPTAREIDRMPDPASKPLIEGITPAPLRPAARAAVGGVEQPAPAAAVAPHAAVPPPPALRELRVPMPDDPTEEPASRRR